MEEILDAKNPQQPNYYNNPREKSLPNAGAILALGIISIATCGLYGIPGLICGIIALALYRKDKQLYLQNPAVYAQSFKNANAGYVCAIVGTSLSGVFVLIILISVMVQLASL